MSPGYHRNAFTSHQLIAFRHNLPITKWIVWLELGMFALQGHCLSSSIINQRWNLDNIKVNHSHHITHRSQVSTHNHQCYPEICYSVRVQQHCVPVQWSCRPSQSHSGLQLSLQICFHIKSKQTPLNTELTVALTIKTSRHSMNRQQEALWFRCHSLESESTWEDWSVLTY